jgi:hypothetical protein
MTDQGTVSLTAGIVAVLIMLGAIWWQLRGIQRQARGGAERHSARLIDAIQEFTQHRRSAVMESTSLAMAEGLLLLRVLESIGVEMPAELLTEFEEFNQQWRKGRRNPEPPDGALDRLQKFWMSLPEPVRWLAGKVFDKLNKGFSDWAGGVLGGTATGSAVGEQRASGN